MWDFDIEKQMNFKLFVGSNFLIANEDSNRKMVKKK